jgi:hypothetical protein
MARNSLNHDSHPNWVQLAAAGVIIALGAAGCAQATKGGDRTSTPQTTERTPVTTTTTQRRDEFACRAGKTLHLVAGENTTVSELIVHTTAEQIIHNPDGSDPTEEQEKWPIVQACAEDLRDATLISNGWQGDDRVQQGDHFTFPDPEVVVVD